MPSFSLKMRGRESRRYILLIVMNDFSGNMTFSRKTAEEGSLGCSGKLSTRGGLRLHRRVLSLLFLLLRASIIGDDDEDDAAPPCVSTLELSQPLVHPRRSSKPNNRAVASNRPSRRTSKRMVGKHRKKHSGKYTERKLFLFCPGNKESDRGPRLQND